MLGFDGEALGFDEPLMLELPLRPPLPAAPPDVPPLAPDCANTAPLLPAISAAATIARVFRVFVIICSLGSPPRGNVTCGLRFLLESLPYASTAHGQGLDLKGPATRFPAYKAVE